MENKNASYGYLLKKTYRPIKDNIMVRTDYYSRNRRKIRVKKRVFTNDSSDDSDIERTIGRVRAKFGARCPTNSSEQARIALNSRVPSSSSEHDIDSEDPIETSSNSMPVETAVGSSPSDPESSDNMTLKIAVNSSPSDPRNSDSVTVPTAVNSSSSDPKGKDSVPGSECKETEIETSDSATQESDDSNKVVSQRCSASSATARTSSESEAQDSPWRDNYFKKYIKTTRSDASSVSLSPTTRKVLRKRTSRPGRARQSTSHPSLPPFSSLSRSRPNIRTPTQESRNESRSSSSSRPNRRTPTRGSRNKSRSGSSSSDTSESSNSSNCSQRSSVTSSSSNSSSSSTSQSKSSSSSSDSNKSSSSSNKSSGSVDSHSNMSRSSVNSPSSNSTSSSSTSSHESRESSPNNNKKAYKILVHMTEHTSPKGHIETSPMYSKKSTSTPAMVPSKQSVEICDKRFVLVPDKPVSNPVKLPSSRPISNRMPGIFPGTCFSTTPMKNPAKSTAKSHRPPLQIIVKIPLTNDLIYPDKTPDNVPLKYPISIPPNNITGRHMGNKKSNNIPSEFPYSLPVSIPLDSFVSVPQKSTITISSKVSESNNLVDEYPVSVPVSRSNSSMSIINTPEEVYLAVPPSSPVSLLDTSSSQDSEKDESVNTSEGSDHDEEVSLVKEICGKRWSLGSWQYCVKWHGYGSEDDTWEEEGVLECFDHIAAYESNKPPPPPAPSQGTQYEDGPHGYERGLPAEKILGASRLPDGQTCYLIKWEGCNVPDWITASQANRMSPQTVINFFEQRYRIALDQIRIQEEDEQREIDREKIGERETMEDGKEKEKSEEENKKEEFRKKDREMETEEDEETTNVEKFARNKQLVNDQKKEKVLVNKCEKMVIDSEKEMHQEGETAKGDVSGLDDDIIPMEVESDFESELH